MARTITQILNVTNDTQAGQADLAALNSPSQTAIYRLWKYVFSLCQLYLEQLIDFKKADIEATVAAGAIGSDAWIKSWVLRFQYSAINTQALQLDNNFTPYYPVVDPALQIITRCSVKTADSSAMNVNVKVAKGEPPNVLNSFEFAALSNFLANGGNSTDAASGIGFAGVRFGIINAPPDRVYVKATIAYEGQFSEVIQTDVIAAINQYFADLSSAAQFAGIFRTTDLVAYVKAVPGVIDIAIEDLAHRRSTVLIGSASYIIQSFLQTAANFEPFAGYVIAEDTATYTLSDTGILTFEVQ